MGLNACFPDTLPSDESLGYFRLSLRDTQTLMGYLPRPVGGAHLRKGQPLPDGRGSDGESAFRIPQSAIACPLPDGWWAVPTVQLAVDALIRVE